MANTIAPQSSGLRAIYGKSLEWLVLVLMVVLFIEVTIGIVFRTLGNALVWYDEVASILLAWLTFYGAALASFKRGHIGCPEVVNLMPPHLKTSFQYSGAATRDWLFCISGVDWFTTSCRCSPLTAW